MITIFRRIRQKLIDSGSVTKYLLYATGEILLVVIGILIALQVNNWNELQKREELKNSILLKIKSEIKTDLNNIELVKQSLDNKFSDGMYLANFLSSEQAVSDLDEERLSKAFMQTGTAEEFTPIDLAFVELTSTGTANLINDDSLKILLFEHYNNSVREEGILNQRSQYSANFSDERFKYLPQGVFIEKNKYELKVGDYSENLYSSFKLDWSQIINDGSMAIQLDKLLGVYIGQEYLLRESEITARKILERIDMELGVQ